VPRPDTETLVEVALRRTATRSLGARYLDLCTGSGCVAISLARERVTCHVTAVDVSPEAVTVARDNAIRLGAVPQTAWYAGDLFAPLAPGARFDLITANPPYIPTADIAGLVPDIRDFEPHVALSGGTDGLAVMRRVVADSPRYLREGGVLAVEMQSDQAEGVRALFVQAGFSEIEVDRDYGAHERVVSGVRR
jgi:release factor glutamine methyltransferase